MRNTSSHAKNRRSHHALKGKRLTKEKGSGAVHPRHRALLDGTPYRGRSVLDTTAKRNTADAKQKATVPKSKTEEKKEVEETKEK